MTAYDDLAQELETVQLAALAEAAPRLPWDAFLARFQPAPGEHIAIIGSTGQGKTYLQRHMMPLFPFNAVFATKPQDDTMSALIERQGYLRMNQWRRMSIHEHPNRVIWPPCHDLQAEERQAKVFGQALDLIFREAGRPREKPVGWAVHVDELWYLSHRLGLKGQVEQFLFQARSLGHTFCVATQMPFFVPSAVYTQSKHLFFFQENEERSLKRLGELRAHDRRVVRYAVPRLEPHQVLYVNNHTGQMIRTRTPPPPRG